ncbi:MAG TPA: pseudouridine synthase [Brevundimonas sp.]|uniref:pseudouridine synthase n=1 Tax=Brevundimonas sp. TaxID=1871086 RepID=UPI002C4CA6E9|nr:pseudouridine synthase [Brevundimonas sp.]HRH21535.1 pseudouridine synthase [Brevundimonas sp.]
MDKPPAKPFAKGKPKHSDRSKDKVPAESVRKERIAKRLARAGVASRREIERLIGLGRIAVNGRVLDTPAVLVSAQDVVTVDGRPVERPEATRVWRFHKPVGLITAAKDPAGRPTVFDALPEGMPRVVKVGRLDINSEGLLLLTNDGELARALELPATGWVRRYRARARGSVTQDRLDTLKNGIVIEGVRYGPIEATLDKAKEKSADGKAPANLWISVALTEGKNREVRKVLEHLGVTVNRLIRLSYGPFQLGTLAEGEVAEVGPRVIREQLASMIHPESLPLGDDVEALPSAPKKARAGLADPSMKPSKVRAHAAKQAALAAEISERAQRRESRRDEDDRPRRSGPGRDGGPRREFKPRDGDGGDRPKRAYTPRDRAEGDRPRRPFKPRDGEGGDRAKRDFKPRDRAEGGDRPKRDFKPRDRAEGGDRPKRDFKPRDRAEGGDRPKRDFKPRDRSESGDRPKRDFKPRSGPGGPRPGGPPPGGPRKPR